ncbi:MAG: cation acetate symporter, partial [Gammaproteobacteria bacterium]|nr:cation acetate symporter [Gammaproteobacteria bacterium]
LWMDDGDGRVRYSAGGDNEIFRNGKLSTNDLIVINKLHHKWINTNGTEGNDGRVVMRQKGLSGPDRDIIVLATPEMAELANWIIALVAAGGLAAALSTASGLLLVISASISHDLYYRIINQKATEKKRLLLGRAVIGFAVVVAGLLGIYPPGFVSQVVAFAFGLAAASFFPTIVMGIFNKRVGTVPAVCGMLAGIIFTAYYIITCVFFGMEPWTFGLFESGINPQGIGTIGMLLNFIVTLILMPFFRTPDKKVQDMVDSVREPEGVGPAIEIETAPEH